jgi:hypothetical protein
MKSQSCLTQRFGGSNSKTHGSRAGTTYFLVVAFLATVCGLFTLSGCASMEAKSQESLLKSAGFQARTPSTPKQKAAYAALPAYKLHRGTWKGKTIYAYKDEKAGVVWVGKEAQYQQFRQLAAKAKLAEEKQVAHNMDNDLVYRWYGSWSDFGAASPID